MSRLLPVFLLVTVVGFLSAPRCFAAEADVVELGDGNFKSGVAQYETALVMFYAPWCGHCKRLKPEFAKAAETLKNNDPPVILAKVDCTEAGKEICGSQGVNGYPTLKIFRNGELSQEYNGPRDAPGIVKYMKSQVGPSSKFLKTAADLEALLGAADDVVVVGVFKDDKENLAVEHAKVANKMRDRCTFAHTHDLKALKKLTDSNDKEEAIVLVRPSHLKNTFEKSNVVFEGSASTEALQKFIEKEYHGLVGHRRPDNQNDFKQPLVVAYYSVDYVKNAKGTNYWRNRVLKVAKKLEGVFNFAISNKDEFQHELNEFGVDFVKGDKPVVFARDEKSKKFIMKKEFTLESFEEFMNDLKDGKLEPHIKSESVPESNDGPVKVAVAKNFDDLVTNSDRDALIEFYAPWCGHCKKLAPVYDELGTALAKENVDIIKMDATANDVPSNFDVRGFPTIYWVPAGSRDSPVRYDGGRELNDFIKYIAKHATNELSSYDRKGNAKKTEL